MKMDRNTVLSGNMSNTEDNFRKVFKYYKKKSPPPNLQDVLDMNIVNSEKMRRLQLTNPNMEPMEGLLPVQDWCAYELIQHPGCICVANPFCKGSQRYWAERCLNHYPRKPNHRNLDAHAQFDDCDNVWLSKHRDEKGKRAMDYLRWVTLGYHHDWDTKKYSFEQRNEFPADLAYFSRYVATALGFTRFTPQAAIVNYYHFDSTLSGHTDHSELDWSAPLISLSLGQTAIFLVGGATVDVVPSAVFLRSGDIVVLSAASRLAYHAIPKVVKPPQPGWLPSGLSDQPGSLPRGLPDESGSPPRGPPPACDSRSDGDTCNPVDGSEQHLTEINRAIKQATRTQTPDAYSDYLHRTRINVNIRQVLKPSQNFPNDDS